MQVFLSCGCAKLLNKDTTSPQYRVMAGKGQCAGSRESHHPELATGKGKRSERAGREPQTRTAQNVTPSHVHMQHIGSSLRCNGTELRRKFVNLSQISVAQWYLNIRDQHFSLLFPQSLFDKCWDSTNSPP